MRKVLLVTEMFSPRDGGAEKYYFEICSRLPADKVVVLANSKLLEYGDVPRTKFKLIFKPFFYTSKLVWPKWLRLFINLQTVIKDEKPNILWAGEVLPAGLVVSFTAKLNHLPYFVSTHGADVLNPQKKSGLQGRWKTRLLKYVLLRSFFVVANAEYTRLLLSKLGLPRDRSLVIYPDASHKPPAEEVQTKITGTVENLKQAGFTILYGLNRLEDRKGIDMTIKALPQVWQDRPKVAYVIAGSGPYENKLKRLAKSVDHFVENRERIIFAGRVDDSTAKRLYELSDIFIMVPRIIRGLTEGFGIVYVEAASFGKPVIGSKITGIPEAVIELYNNNYAEATGLLIGNQTSPNEIAKKILMLVKDKGLAQKLGKNGKEHAKKFDWANGARILEQRLS